MSVRFRFGWVDAGPSPDILAQSTMASLSVDVGGATVTSVLDRGNRIYTDEVVVPLSASPNGWSPTGGTSGTRSRIPASKDPSSLPGTTSRSPPMDFVLPSLTMTAASGRM